MPFYIKRAARMKPFLAVERGTKKWRRQFRWWAEWEAVGR